MGTWPWLKQGLGTSPVLVVWGHLVWGLKELACCYSSF